MTGKSRFSGLKERFPGAGSRIDVEGNRLLIVLSVAGVGISLISGLFAGGASMVRWVRGGESTVPADEQLELVEVEFSDELIMVPIQSSTEGLDSLPGAPSDLSETTEDASASDVGTADEASARELIVTLRNNYDDTAVLTAIRVDVHDSTVVDACLFAGGGAILPTAVYEFTFPLGAEPWTRTDQQNFSIEPHGVDALSINVGPRAPNLPAGVTYSFTVTAISASGKEAVWADVIGTDWLLPEESEIDALTDDAVDLVGSGDLEIRGPDSALSCARMSLDDLLELREELPETGQVRVIDSSVDSQIAYYEQLIEKLSS